MPKKSDPGSGTSSNIELRKSDNTKLAKLAKNDYTKSVKYDYIGLAKSNNTEQ